MVLAPFYRKVEFSNVLTKYLKISDEVKKLKTGQDEYKNKVESSV